MLWRAFGSSGMITSQRAQPGQGEPMIMRPRLRKFAVTAHVT
jgi:hypothetical protein